jgi:hypothetical protein
VRFRPAPALLFALTLALPACRCIELPDRIYACEPGGGCDPGFTCIAGFCEPTTSSDAGLDGGSDAGTDAGCFVISDCTAEECGLVRPDNCGGVLDCGACQLPNVCGLHEPHRCGCDPVTTPAQACPKIDGGVLCGELTIDNCGTPQTFTCGLPCITGVCSENVCCLSPSDSELCASSGFQCGPGVAIDRCGTRRTLSCGLCSTGLACVANETGSACVSAMCSPETDPEFCDHHGANCGALTAMDTCGHTRTGVPCGGPCDAGECDSKLPNQCHCQGVLSGCLDETQCCTGATCNKQGLCCTSLRQSCGDDGECCSGLCSAGTCCVAAGSACASDLDCCSGHCGSDGGCGPILSVPDDGGGPL